MCLCCVYVLVAMRLLFYICEWLCRIFSSLSLCQMIWITCDNVIDIWLCVWILNYGATIQRYAPWYTHYALSNEIFSTHAHIFYVFAFDGGVVLLLFVFFAFHALIPTSQWSRAFYSMCLFQFFPFWSFLVAERHDYERVDFHFFLLCLLSVATVQPSVCVCVCL